MTGNNLLGKQSDCATPRRSCGEPATTSKIKADQNNPIPERFGEPISMGRICLK
jgi:hypothetical protein